MRLTVCQASARASHGVVCHAGVRTALQLLRFAARL